MIVAKQNYMLAEDINEVIIMVNTANTDVTAIMEEVKECRVYGRL